MKGRPIEDQEGSIYKELNFIPSECIVTPWLFGKPFSLRHEISSTFCELFD